MADGRISEEKPHITTTGETTINAQLEIVGEDEIAFKHPIRNVVTGQISDALRHKYKHLHSVKVGVKSRRLDWEDTNLLALDFVDISSYRTQADNHRQAIVNIAMSSFSDRVSAQSVAAMLQCAWHPRSSENQSNFCFAEMPNMVQNPTPTQSLESRVTSIAAVGTVTAWNADPNVTWEEYEQAASFLCAAALRMTTKDENNFIKAFAAICGQYRNFYQYEFPITLVLDLQCLNGIRQLLHTRTLRNTIGVFLLAFQELEGQDKGLCRMLFEMHLRYTGMHSYELFLTCADRLKIPREIFFPLLSHPLTTDALNTIEQLLTRYEFPLEGEATVLAMRARTWKYARIFNSEMYADIQTKNCNIFVALLATISQRLGTTGAGDVTQIAQIQSTLHNMRDWLDDRAARVIAHANEKCIFY